MIISLKNNDNDVGSYALSKFPDDWEMSMNPYGFVKSHDNLSQTLYFPCICLTNPCVL